MRKQSGTVKALTLNTHSWVELHQIPKIKTLARFIAEQDIDIVLLQEVNQHQETRPAGELPRYIPVTERAVHHDNYALILVQFLEDLGKHYHWSWIDSHEAWHAYDEGVAVLTKSAPTRVQPIIMDDDQHDYSKVWRRAALAVEVETEAGQICFASTHMNWWRKENLYLFEKDFARLDEQVRNFAGNSPIVLAGDFNNGCEIREEGYDQVLALGWHDTYSRAKTTSGQYTVHKKIAGWEKSTRAMRIDFFFTNKPVEVAAHSVEFADNTAEAISDHSGVLIEFDPTYLF